MLDPVDRFTPAAEEYARFRPDYPEDVVRICARHAGLNSADTVVDVGCGTGIASRLFARHGYHVIGVEPNEAMRACAARAGGGPEYRAGKAEATGLPDGCAKLVIAAQALAWFNLPAALTEWRRVANPSGACAAFSHMPGTGAWFDTFMDLYRRFVNEDARKKLASPSTEAAFARLKESPHCRKLELHELLSPQSIELATMQGRAWTQSEIANSGVNRAAFNEALREAFESLNVNGRAEYAYRLVVATWRPND